MQFGIIEDGPNFGTITRLAFLFVGLSIFVMIYIFITMLAQYAQLRRQFSSLISPILAQIKKDGWEPNDETSSEAKDSQFDVYSVSLRLALGGGGPIPVIESLNRTIDLAGRRFKQLIHYSRFLGWSVCLIGLIGALSHTSVALRAASYLKDLPPGLLPHYIAWSADLLEIALVIGLIWLAGSYFGQNRLSSLYSKVSELILKATEEGKAEELKPKR